MKRKKKKPDYETLKNRKKPENKDTILEKQKSRMTR